MTYSCSVDEWRANSVDCSSLLAASPIAPKAERLKLSSSVDGAPAHVVYLDRLLRVLELHELLVVTELLVHGILDAPDELARPELSAPMPT